MTQATMTRSTQTKTSALATPVEPETAPAVEPWALLDRQLNGSSLMLRLAPPMHLNHGNLNFTRMNAVQAKITQHMAAVRRDFTDNDPLAANLRALESRFADVRDQKAKADQEANAAKSQRLFLLEAGNNVDKAEERLEAATLLSKKLDARADDLNEMIHRAREEADAALKKRLAGAAEQFFVDAMRDQQTIERAIAPALGDLLERLLFADALVQEAQIARASALTAAGQPIG